MCIALLSAEKFEEKKWLRLVRRSPLFAGLFSTSIRFRNFLSLSLMPLSLRVSVASRSEMVFSFAVKNEAVGPFGDAACIMVSSSFWLTVCCFFFLLPKNQDITIESLNKLQRRSH